jgi:uncharacterized membrane protein YkoI
VRSTLVTLFVATVVAPMSGTESKLKLAELPHAVQAAAKQQAKTSAIVGFSKEFENGQTLYEIETRVGGKSRDLLVDKTGRIIEIEQEIDLSTIPEAARAAIQQRSAGGRVTKTESVTHGAQVSYEATVKTKAGKTQEIAVNADGTVHKE